VSAVHDDGTDRIQTIQTQALGLMQSWSESDPTQAGRFDFPIHVGTGSMSSSLVYFEVQPGQHCGRHTHSAEEIAYIVAGSAEVEIGDMRASASDGGLTLIPAMALHDVHNVGSTTLKVIGFFSAAAVVTTFGGILSPLGTSTIVIGAPLEEPALAQ
jgi:quercetin dioxygenase-like cupin family protein